MNFQTQNNTTVQKEVLLKQQSSAVFHIPAAVNVVINCCFEKSHLILYVFYLYHAWFYNKLQIFVIYGKFKLISYGS